MSAASQPLLERAHRPRPLGRWAAATLLASLLVLTLAAHIADHGAASRRPTEAELEQSIRATRDAFRDGDVVRVEPSWWTLPWSGLVGAGPDATSWPFRALHTSEEVDPLEVLGHERLLLITAFGRPAELPPLLEHAGKLERVIQQSDHLTVSSWHLEPLSRMHTLTRELPRLKVSRRNSTEKPSPCRFSANKHRCGSDSWLDVALEGRVVARREVEWLFVHPGPKGTNLDIVWDGLPRAAGTDRTWLYVRIGPSLEAVRHPEGGPVTLEVRVDDAPVDTVVIEPRRFDLERRAIALPPGQGNARVTFRITCEENAWRETMLEADVLDRLPTTLRQWATIVLEP